MLSNPSTIFSGATSDNITANKNAWKIFKEKYASCYFQCSCSHDLHFLAKDIITATIKMKMGAQEATYPDGYPLEHLLNFTEGSKVISKVIENSHVVKAEMQKAEKAAGITTLFKMTKTRLAPTQIINKL